MVQGEFAPLSNITSETYIFCNHQCTERACPSTLHRHSALCRQASHFTTLHIFRTRALSGHKSLRGNLRSPEGMGSGMGDMPRPHRRVKLIPRPPLYLGAIPYCLYLPLLQSVPVDCAVRDAISGVHSDVIPNSSPRRRLPQPLSGSTSLLASHCPSPPRL